jgi:hypothetical protein
MADLSRALVKLQPTLALTARRGREHLLSRRFEPHLWNIWRRARSAERCTWLRVPSAEVRLGCFFDHAVTTSRMGKGDMPSGEHPDLPTKSS